MLKGGIKENSEDTYMQHYSHFMTAIFNLGHDPTPIPITHGLIVLYLADCCLKPKPNVYPTIRGKMRALDWVNQQVGVRTVWHEDGFLQPMVSHFKKHYPGEGSHLIPFYLGDITRLMKYIESKFNYFQCRETLRFEWYLYYVYVILSYSCAFRISEIIKHRKANNKLQYGIRFCDFEFGYNTNDNKIEFKSYNRSLRNKLRCIRITIQNSKTKRWNETDIAYIGRVNNKALWNPLLIVFDSFERYNAISKLFPNTYKFKFKSKEYFFQNENGYFTESWCRKKLKRCFSDIGYSNIININLHCFRKGFNSWLSSIGVNEGRVASAGRWYLYASFYRYVILDRSDMINITQLLWTPNKSKLVQRDFDQCKHLFKNSK